MVLKYSIAFKTRRLDFFNWKVISLQCHWFLPYNSESGISIYNSSLLEPSTHPPFSFCAGFHRFVAGPIYLLYLSYKNLKKLLCKQKSVPNMQVKSKFISQYQVGVVRKHFQVRLVGKRSPEQESGDLASQPSLLSRKIWVKHFIPSYPSHLIWILMIFSSSGTH